MLAGVYVLAHWNLSTPLLSMMHYQNNSQQCPWMANLMFRTNFALRASWSYRVELQSLCPSSVYYYQIASTNRISISEIFNFTST